MLVCVVVRLYKTTYVYVFGGWGVVVVAVAGLCYCKTMYKMTYVYIFGGWGVVVVAVAGLGAGAVAVGVGDEEEVGEVGRRPRGVRVGRLHRVRRVGLHSVQRSDLRERTHRSGVAPQRDLSYN